MNDSPRAEPKTVDQAKPSPEIAQDTAHPAGTPTAAGVTLDFPSAAPTPVVNPIAGTLDYPTVQPPHRTPGLEATVDSVGPAPQADDAAFSWTEEPVATTAADQPPAPVGYQILGVLGHGGMGVVYQARQTALNRLVALKMLLAGAHASPLQLARFRTEAEAVARLQHPNIVQIYEVGLLAGLPYFSLEFVDGGSLEKKLAGKPLPIREAAKLIRTLAGAMHYAHQHGIIHRDLKPANVLLSADGTPKVTDFGLAKKLDAAEASHTRTGTLMGTPSYMAPEQARGGSKEVGPLADVYALGAVFYELLTGRPPFQAATILDTLDQVQHQEPVPPTRLQPKVPRDLETICLKCLQKEPAKRYADAQALADDLTRFLEDRPIRARPVGRTERLVRWCRKNPRTAALNTAVVLLLLALTAVTAVVGLRASRDREAIAKAREVVRGQLDEARGALARGDVKRAQVLLGVSDPALESGAALADLRGERDVLRAQAALYEEFKKRVDAARYAALFGTRSQGSDGRSLNPKEAQRRSLEGQRRLCQEAIRLVDEIEGRTGLAAEGMPALDSIRETLWREDVFEVFLIAAWIEWKRDDLQNDPAAEKAVGLQNLAWLDRAEKYLPGTLILAKRRAVYRKASGLAETPEMDQRTKGAASAVDHFWSGVDARFAGESAKTPGDAKEAQKQFRAAVTEYAALLQMRPDHFWGYFEWATCQLRLGNAADALIGFTVCTNLKPDAAWPYYNRGTINFQRQQFDLAIGDFDKAVEHDPLYAEAYHQRGLCHAALKQARQAVEDYSRAIAARPDYYLAYFNRGAANLLLKDFAPALEDFRRAASLDPRDFLSHYLIGVIYLGQRDYDKALAALEQAMAVRLDFNEAYLARAQIRLRKGQKEEALADVNFVLKRVPPAKKPEVLNDRADVLTALGRLEEAAADLQESIKLAPQKANAYVALARLFERQHQADQARACFDRLVAANPKMAEAYLRRAEFRRDHGQFPEALADCDAAAQRAKDSVLPGLVRASITAAQGNHAAAVTEAEQLLARGPADDGHVLYAAACVWGLAAKAAASQPDEQELSRRYTDRAIALVAATQDKGFHDLQYEEHNRIPDDPALLALNQDPRFLKALGR
jgi:tetratricopeptide (TPR) repeat protein